MCTFQAGRCTGWGSEGVNMHAVDTDTACCFYGHTAAVTAPVVFLATCISHYC